MSIHIKENTKPKLDVIEMKCDKPLNKILDRYEMTKHLNCHSTNLLIGKPRSGKTSLLVSIFDKMMRNTFNNIFLFQPSASRSSMKKDIFEDLPDEHKFNELTFENLEFVKTLIESEPECNHVIIFDDMGAYLRENMQIRKLFKELIFNRRHLHVSIYFLCQTYLSLEPDLRKMFTNIFVFKVNDQEFKKILEEQMMHLKDFQHAIASIVWDRPHQYLFINTDTSKIYKNFDELIINN
jgi:hypothetical protein